jgi:hypothetical protein
MSPNGHGIPDEISRDTSVEKAKSKTAISHHFAEENALIGFAAGEALDEIAPQANTPKHDSESILSRKMTPEYSSCPIWRTISL